MRKSAKSNKVVPLRSTLGTPVYGHVAGRIMHRGKDGFAVDFLKNPHGPILARSIVSISTLQRACKAAAQPEVLLVFEEGCTHKPVIIGLLDAAAAPEPIEQTEVFVDGKRVVLEGMDEIVLKCGKSLLVLRSNGRIVVRGTHIETEAEGVNRIKGSAVQVN